MSLPVITPQDAKLLADKGALLVDVREPHEFSGGHIEGALNMPLSSIAGQTIGKPGETVIFMCKSGARTNMAARQLEQVSKGKTMIMGGGLMAWQLQGLPVAAPEAGKAGGFFSRMFS